MPVTISKSLAWLLSSLINFLAFLIAAWIIVNLSRYLFHLLSGRKSKFTFYFFRTGTLLLSVCFSFLGLSIGLLVGLSQSPVVHVTIPALLTFYGGFITYLLAKDSFKDDESRLATLFSAIAVSCFMIYGVELGSIEKNSAIRSAKEFELHYLQEELRIRQEFPVK